jgi:hypothetical protein
MCCGSNQVDYEPEQSLDLLYGTNGRAFDYNNTKIPFQVQPQVLYVPGRLIHVVKNDSFRSRTQRLWSGPIYQAVWTDNTTYDRVLISEGMFFDHLPNNLMHAMKMLFSSKSLDDDHNNNDQLARVKNVIDYDSNNNNEDMNNNNNNEIAINIGSLKGL